MEQDSKKIIIIGGGVAGLSAGCYLQMNGYKTEIFESNNTTGGLCTAWRRQDYLIDGCIHWLVGINQISKLNKLWDELVDIKTLPLVVYKEFCSYEENGQIAHFYTDFDKLKKHLTEISPEDSIVINELISAGEKIATLNFNSFPTKIKSIYNIFSLLLSYKKWLGTVTKYTDKIKHPLIKKLLITSLPTNSPMILLLQTISWFNNQNAGYPIGGSSELIGRMTEKYKLLGGKLNYNTRVLKILVENNKAQGVQLENGQKFNSDMVVSAADGRFTIINMLEEKYQDKKTKQIYYQEEYEPKDSVIYISLGVARKFVESYKPYLFFSLKKPLLVDGVELKYLGVTIHNFDPKAAPAGKTVLTVMVPTNNPRHWIELRKNNKNEYNQQKNQIAQEVISELDEHLGNIKNNLEVIDIATPATYFRYTNNWNGVPMAWQNFKLFIFKPNKIIKGLNDFYMCGQWVGDVGLPGAARSGKTIAKMICKQDGKIFKTKK